MKVTAKINDVAFSKQSRTGNWMIILTDKGTFKGEMAADPKSGSEYEFNGDWKVYNGQKEFKFIGSMPVIPVDPYALLYYCCNIAKGIGPKLRDRIWEQHGENWEAVFDGNVKPLGEGDMTKGLTSTKSQAIQEAIEDAKLNETQVKVISYMMRHKCSEGLAYKAWNEWKADTIPKLEENCFCLTELFMVGFGHVDKIRDTFNMSFTDPRRIKSGVAYSYKQCSASGCTAISEHELIAECEKNLRISRNYIVKVLQIMLESNEFKLFNKGGNCYFSLWEDYVYELVVNELIQENSNEKRSKFW